MAKKLSAEVLAAIREATKQAYLDGANSVSKGAKSAPSKPAGFSVVKAGKAYKSGEGVTKHDKIYLNGKYVCSRYEIFGEMSASEKKEFVGLLFV